MIQTADWIVDLGPGGTGYSLTEEEIYGLLRLTHRVAAVYPDELAHHPRGARHHE